MRFAPREPSLAGRFYVGRKKQGHSALHSAVREDRPNHNHVVATADLNGLAAIRAALEAEGMAFTVGVLAKIGKGVIWCGSRQRTLS